MRILMSRDFSKIAANLFGLLVCLMISWSVQATAPRVAAPLFSDETKIDIVGHSFALTGGAADKEMALIVDLLTQIFKESAASPIIDILPSKQVAHYEFMVNEVPALIIELNDAGKQKLTQYRKIVFYLRDTTSPSEPIALAFGKNNSRADELYRSFDRGLQLMIGTGDYLKVLQQHLSAGDIPADYIDRLKRANPHWK